jgi:hypothetical protein
MLEYPDDGVAQSRDCSVQIRPAEPMARQPPDFVGFSLLACFVGLALVSLLLCCRWPRAFDVWLDGRPGRRDY